MIYSLPEISAQLFNGCDNPRAAVIWHCERKVKRRSVILWRSITCEIVIDQLQSVASILTAAQGHIDRPHTRG